MFTVALLLIAKRWKQPKRPTTDEYINNEILLISKGLKYMLQHE